MNAGVPHSAADGAPFVSVIMIFFDAARFIKEAIESVIAQTWPHWELLLVDDGSRDASREIAESYRQLMPERIRILEHPARVNRGMSASRNLGLAMADGEYLAFLDADDVYLPTRLERHVRLLEENPDAGAVQSCVEFWRNWPEDPVARRPDQAGKPPPVTLGAPVPPPELFLLMLEARGATVPGICSLTLRRAILPAIGGSEESFRAHYEDQVLYAKVYLSSNVIVMPDRLAKYRQHTESLTARADSPGNEPHRWHAGRDAFLGWLETWLVEQKIGDKLIWASLRHAQRVERPVMLARVLQQALAGMRRLAETILPRSLSMMLVEAWGRCKLAFSALRVARAHSRISRQLGTARHATLARERQPRDDGVPPSA